MVSKMWEDWLLPNVPPVLGPPSRITPSLQGVELRADRGRVLARNVARGAGGPALLGRHRLRFLHLEAQEDEGGARNQRPCS